MLEPHRSPIHKISRGAGLGLGIGSIIWLTLLLWHAHKVGAMDIPGQQAVAIGPLVLHYLGKFNDNGAAYATISFEPGLALYAAGCLCLGMAAGSIAFWRSWPSNQTKEARSQ